MAIKGIDYEKCTECGQCYEVCPMDCFGNFASRVFVKYPEDCMTCFQCSLVCPAEACIVDHGRAQPIPTGA